MQICIGKYIFHKSFYIKLIFKIDYIIFAYIFFQKILFFLSNFLDLRNLHIKERISG